MTLPTLSSLEANAIVLKTTRGQIRLISVHKAPDRPLDIENPPVNRFNVRQTDWVKFSTLLDAALVTANPIINTKADVDKTIDTLLDALSTSLEQSTPIPSRKPSAPSDLSERIKRSITAKN